MRVAAITGLEAEARIARRRGWAARPSGGIAPQTRALAEAFLREGHDGLVSFGIAGALSPSLTSGTLLVPSAVVTEAGERYLVAPRWRERLVDQLCRAGLEFAEGDLLGAAEAAASAERKAALARRTGAIAVDLESHLVAQAASAAERPFLVLRAIADGADRALPPAAVNGLDAMGKPALARVLLAVAREPAQIPALIRLAGDTRRALVALDRALAVVSLADISLGKE